jgi:predicted ATPase/tetratricopeptide (TPR) repeat protein
VATASQARVRLLGGFAAAVDGSEVSDGAWRLRKAKELVKLLALADAHRLHREQAMEALWPNRDPASAANNLNQAVHAARRALGADAIVVRESLLELDAVVDVDVFEQAAAEARRTRTVDSYERALALYGGELLPENRYDDWASFERERLVELRSELADELEARGGSRPERRRLPLDASTFVGREHELAELPTVLHRTRLLTLTGTGGAGKTRLALELARGLEAEFADGVVLAELDSLVDSERVADAIAESLDLRALPGEAVLDALAEELAPLELLLVLDNCEHVLGASATAADALLRSAPRLTVLATSREPLRVPGEVVFRVPSLAIPDPEASVDPEQLLRYEAVRLFVERATAVAPGFEIDLGSAPAVARICHRLDGLPLALELAAARVDAIAPAALAERLDDRFRLLRAASRPAPTRQQTLEATLQWSHDLLGPAEETLFRRLAVFAGGFTLEAVEEVGPGGGLERTEIADVLAGLVEKSLVGVDDRDGTRRYRLLETIRAYATARLQEAGERDGVELRHARWLTDLVEGQDTQLSGLEPEQGNLRVALETLLRREHEEALRLCARVWPFWLRRIELAEARRWLGQALERAPEPSADRVHVLLGHAAIEFRAGDGGFGVGKAEEAYELALTLGDPRLEWRAVHFRGGIAIGYDDGAAAARDYGEALGLARRYGLGPAEAVSVYSLGAAAWVAGDLAEAEARLAESADLFGRLGDSAETVPALVNLAELTLHQRDVPGVRLVFEDTLQPFADVSCRLGAGYVRLNWASVARSTGDVARARALLEEALAYFVESASERGQADAWARLAYLALAESRHEEATELFERARAVRSDLGDRRGVGLALVGLGAVAITTGDKSGAARLLQEATDTFRRAGDRWGLVSALWRTSELELARDCPDAAEERLEEAMRVVDETRRTRWQAVTRANLAETALLRGNAEKARELLAEALAGFEEVGDARAAAHVRERLARLRKGGAKEAQRGHR